MKATSIVNKLIEADDSTLAEGTHRLRGGAYYTIYSQDWRSVSQFGTFRTKKPIAWIGIDRIYVPPALRGQGIVPKILQKLTSAADAEGAALEVAIAPDSSVPAKAKSNFLQAFINAGFKVDDKEWKSYVRMPQVKRIGEAELRPEDDPEAFFAAEKEERKIKKLEIVGRRWYRRSVGGVYCKAYIYINDKLVHVTPEQYGYGDHYLTLATDWLRDNNYIDLDRRTPIWYLRDRGDFELSYYAVDVKRERDL